MLFQKHILAPPPHTHTHTHTPYTHAPNTHMHIRTYSQLNMNGKDQPCENCNSGSCHNHAVKIQLSCCKGARPTVIPVLYYQDINDLMTSLFDQGLGYIYIYTGHQWTSKLQVVIKKVRLKYGSTGNVRTDSCHKWYFGELQARNLETKQNVTKVYSLFSNPCTGLHKCCL